MQSSYRQILKSSSIMGGAAAVTMLFSLVRTKFAAEFIGVMGVALLANFTVLQNLITRWRDWTGARSIYLKLRNEHDLGR